MEDSTSSSSHASVQEDADENVDGSASSHVEAQEDEQSSVKEEGPDSFDGYESEYDEEDDYVDEFSSSSQDSYVSDRETELQTSSSRVIAVGLPSDLVAESGIPMTTGPSIVSSASSSEPDESKENERRPQTEVDAHQEAISEVVAESLAEREHNEKMGVQKPPPGAFATMTPRTSTVDGKQLVGQGSLAAPDLEKGTTSGSMSRGSATGEEGDSEEIEAEVGIPIGMPGAFAIGGIEPDRPTGWESDFEEEENTREESMELRPPQDAPERGPVDLTRDQGPIVGVLSNRALIETEEEGDEAIVLDVLPAEEPRSVWRGRFLLIALIVVLAAVAIIVVAVVASSDSSPSTDVPEDTGWNIVGDGIFGPIDDNVEFANAVSLASDGNRVAVGAPGWNLGATRRNVGQSRVMDWTGTDWIVSTEITGPGTEARAGSSISLSRDGFRVAIGAPSWENDQGHVVVYEEASDTWNVVGSELSGNEAENGKFGTAVALSPNGNILVVGAPTTDGTAGENSGVVRAFTSANNSSWLQLGSSIEGDAALDQLGWSVALCANGQRLVSGAPGSDAAGGGTGDFTGVVRILILEGGEWVQLGQDIYGTASEDRFGHSVACSDDGSIVAVGANQNTNPGYVRVFQYNNGTDRWIQMGEDILGDDNFDSFGFSVALSSNGKGLAAGSPLNDDIERDAGQVQVFEFNDDNMSWSQSGGDITGTSLGDRFGWSVSLSAIGDRLACGSPFADFDGRVINVGKVEVYQREAAVER